MFAVAAERAVRCAAGGFTRLNLGANVPLNVTQASAVTAGFATFGPAGTPVAGLYADLSQATAATINAIRVAFQVQKLLERDARGGTRYTEIIRSHFGVVSPDARLQRPEFLGSFTKMVNVNPIAQTSATDNTSPQGNLSAYGVTAAKFHGFTKSFVEHGYIFGLVCARADLTYQQGLS